MPDALDMLKPCPQCLRHLFLTLNGFYCPVCEYEFQFEDGEGAVHAAEVFNASWDEIRAEIAEGVE